MVEYNCAISRPERSLECCVDTKPVSLPAFSRTMETYWDPRPMTVGSVHGSQNHLNVSHYGMVSRGNCSGWAELDVVSARYQHYMTAQFSFGIWLRATLSEEW